MIQAFATTLRERHPGLRGRWGCYVANGPRVDLSNLAPAIDALLLADATIAVEMYPRYADYCAVGRTPAERDAWLAHFFKGGRGGDRFRIPIAEHRFDWLMKRRAEKRSHSRITVVFGVTDTAQPPKRGKLDFVKGPRPAHFLDRLFFVWMNRSGHPEIISAANGGAGSWKWERANVSTSGRDDAFVQSWRHYCQQGKRTNRVDDDVRCR